MQKMTDGTNNGDIHLGNNNSGSNIQNANASNLSNRLPHFTRRDTVTMVFGGGAHFY